MTGPCFSILPLLLTIDGVNIPSSKMNSLEERKYLHKSCVQHKEKVTKCYFQAYHIGKCDLPFKCTSGTKVDVLNKTYINTIVLI